MGGSDGKLMPGVGTNNSLYPLCKCALDLSSIVNPFLSLTNQ